MPQNAPRRAVRSARLAGLCPAAKTLRPGEAPRLSSAPLPPGIAGDFRNAPLAPGEAGNFRHVPLVKRRMASLRPAHGLCVYPVRGSVSSLNAHRRGSAGVTSQHIPAGEAYQHIPAGVEYQHVPAGRSG